MKHEMQTKRNMAVLLTGIVLLAWGLAPIASAKKPPPPADAPYTAEYTDMGCIGINNAGQVVGMTPNNTAGLLTPADWDEDGDLDWFRDNGQGRNSLIQDLGTLFPGDAWARGEAVNDSGQVVGRSGSEDTQAFIWDEFNGMVALGTLGGVGSEAYAINEAGEVVGVADTSSGYAHAFLITPEDGVWFRDANWDGANDLMVDLGTLGGVGSEAYAINGDGQVVGVADTSSGYAHAFLITPEDGVWFRPNGDGANDLMVDLGTLGGDESVALDINDWGQIVGTAKDRRGNPLPFLYSDGAMSGLERLLPEGSAYSLNNATQILGNAVKRVGGTRPQGKSDIHIPTFWEDGVATPLSDLTDADIGRWPGVDINDWGQILTSYYILLPIPDDQ